MSGTMSALSFSSQPDFKRKLNRLIEGDVLARLSPYIQWGLSIPVLQGGGDAAFDGDGELSSRWSCNY